MDQDVGPRTPAYRVDLAEVATERVLRGYSKFQDDFVREHNLLAGYDQCSRRGTPLLTSLYHLDQFKTMAWANAPGTDHMGDARFHQSLADIYGAPRVWFEGFHSLGWGLTLDDQMRLMYEWGREGATLHLPVGMYYTDRALWWEWAPPNLGWNQPHARHYPAFAETMGRLVACLSAGKHVAEVAVLYPQTTVWADTEGTRRWGAAAMRADQCYTDLFGMHSVVSGWELEQADRPSLLAEAFYDRITVDEEHVSTFDVPIVVPSCACLYTATVERLIADAERGRAVVIVEPRPSWSAEHGRDDESFSALVERLCELATVVSSPAEVAGALPPPRADGLKAQWRRVDDLDLVFLTGRGTVRLRGLADRAPELWDTRTGAISPQPARVDGDDLLVDCDGPAALLALPPGVPVAPVETSWRELELPEVWECDYPPWGENRWGDLHLPANDGTPPVERRTFAFREGDDPAWRAAPVTPEDVQQPVFELGFEQRMSGLTGRVPPQERLLGEGWREVVSTYGRKATLTARGEEQPIEYSERLGVEDLTLTTPIGLKGWIEPVKIDLGPDGAGTVRSWCKLKQRSTPTSSSRAPASSPSTSTSRRAIGPVECGVLSIPVRLEAGWHELQIDAEPRAPHLSRRCFHCTARGRARGSAAGVRRAPTIAPRAPVWSWPMLHPDYKGDPAQDLPRDALRASSQPTRLRVELRRRRRTRSIRRRCSSRASAPIEVTIGRTVHSDELMASRSSRPRSGQSVTSPTSAGRCSESAGAESAGPLVAGRRPRWPRPSGAGSVGAFPCGTRLASQQLRATTASGAATS